MELQDREYIIYRIGIEQSKIDFLERAMKTVERTSNEIVAVGKMLDDAIGMRDYYRREFSKLEREAEA